MFLGFLSSRAAAVARPRGSCLGRSLMLGAHEVCATALQCPKGQRVAFYGCVLSMCSGIQSVWTNSIKLFLNSLSIP